MTYLAVKILNGAYIGFAKGTLKEAEDKRRFADSSSAEHYNPILAVRIRHGISAGFF